MNELTPIGAGAAGRSPQPTLVHLDSIPPLARAVVRLFPESAAAEPSLEDGLRALAEDVSLTQRVTRAVAPALNDDVESATSQADLVGSVGVRRVRGLALAGRLLEAFSAPSRARAAPTFDIADHWLHCLAVACAARRLCEAASLRDVHSDDAFVGGLVHDIGKAALHALFPKSYDRITSLAESGQQSWMDREQAVLGTDHTQVGRRVLERWGLPGWVFESAGLHHESATALEEQAKAPTLVSLVRIADALARRQRIGFSGNRLPPNPLGEGIEALGMQPEMLEEAAARLVEDVCQESAILGIPHQGPSAVYHRSLARANAECAQRGEELRGAQERGAADARQLKALIAFESQAATSTDLGAISCALAAAGRVALEFPTLACVPLARESRLAVGWCDPDRSAVGATQVPLTDSLRETLEGWATSEPSILPAGSALRSALREPAARLGDSEPLAVVLSHEHKCVGLLVFAGGEEAASAARRSARLWQQLGLMLARVHSHAASVRVAGDLADTNRRMQEMQAELLRTRTLSMIAEMAAGAGHELNNPLSVISGRAQMVMARLDESSALHGPLSAIQAKAHECSRIVTELMDFARPAAPTFSEVNLAEIVAEACLEWRSQGRIAASRMTLSPCVLPGDDNPWVRADAGQIRVVLHELLQNATDAVMDNSGAIHVDLRKETAREPAAATSVGESAVQSFAHIRVRDTGIGMPQSVLHRVFDPFYSHRKAGRGRGLGLPRAYRIVEAHEGRIWLESTPQQGTTAHVRLQLSPRA